MPVERDGGAEIAGALVEMTASGRDPVAARDTRAGETLRSRELAGGFSGI